MKMPDISLPYYLKGLQVKVLLQNSNFTYLNFGHFQFASALIF